MTPAILPWALSGAAAVAVGYARFAYALILPSMQTDLGLNYAQAGWLNTANALGYLLGALLTVVYVQRAGNKRLFALGVIITTIALLLTGLTRDFTLLSIYRFLAGAGAAGAFICGGVLAGVLGTRAIVIFFSGSGIGMLSTGALLPWLFQYAGPTAWNWAWLAMGVICIPFTVFSLQAARHIEEPNLPVNGRNGIGAPVCPNLLAISCLAWGISPTSPSSSPGWRRIQCKACGRQR